MVDVPAVVEDITSLVMLGDGASALTADVCFSDKGAVGSEGGRW
jgi:hypothetical protein